MGGYRMLPLYVGRSFNLGKEDEGDEVGIALGLPLPLAPSLCIFPPLSLSIYIYIYIFSLSVVLCTSHRHPRCGVMSRVN